MTPLEPPAEGLRGKVLYIEDVPANFEIVQGLLAPHSEVELLHAPTGVEGVRMVLAERPDFVLLDMHLPDISGLEVVRRLSEVLSARRLRVTILTADDLTIDVVKALSLGAYGYLVKPVSREALEAAVRRGLSGVATPKR